jgi:hypothetical protein
MPAMTTVRIVRHRAREVRCGDIHGLPCDERLMGLTPEHLLEKLREHGTLVHGFTAADYADGRFAEALAG